MNREWGFNPEGEQRSKQETSPDQIESDVSLDLDKLQNNLEQGLSPEQIDTINMDGGEASALLKKATNRLEKLGDKIDAMPDSSEKSRLASLIEKVRDNIVLISVAAALLLFTGAATYGFIEAVEKLGEPDHHKNQYTEVMNKIGQTGQDSLATQDSLADSNKVDSNKASNLAREGLLAHQQAQNMRLAVHGF